MITKRQLSLFFVVPYLLLYVFVFVMEGIGVFHPLGGADPFFHGIAIF